jgi:predicted HTH domain antitoxin
MVKFNVILALLIKSMGAESIDFFLFKRKKSIDSDPFDFIRSAKMTLNFTINYPETIPDALHETRDEFEAHAKLAMFTKLFELKKISSGMAASILGISRVDFLLLLHQYQVPMIDIPEYELESDVKNA